MVFITKQFKSPKMHWVFSNNKRSRKQKSCKSAKEVQVSVRRSSYLKTFRSAENQLMLNETAMSNNFNLTCPVLEKCADQ